MNNGSTKLLYTWYSSKLNSFLTMNTEYTYLTDNKCRNIIKVTCCSNDNNVVFKTPLNFSSIRTKKIYRLAIYGYSEITNKGYISLWVNSIENKNNQIIRKNLELYPVVLRNKSDKNEMPRTIYDFTTNNITNIWFGFHFNNTQYNDSFNLYKIELYQVY